MKAPPVYWGEYNITRYSDPTEKVELKVDFNTSSYRFCNQDMLRRQDRSFPFVPSNQPEGDEWMEPQQETVTTVYGWAAVG